MFGRIKENMNNELTEEARLSRAASIKGKMDKLRTKWERLDASGLYCVQANNCQRRVSALGR
jgi:hypothetical protein